MQHQYESNKTETEEKEQARDEMVYKILMLTLAILVIGMAAMFSGCTTETKYVVEPVNTKLETKGHTGEGEVGLNEKREAILQVKRDAIQEYRDHKMVNASIREDIDLELSEWRQCREYLADPRLGGNGRLKELPEVFAEEPEPAKKFGLDERGDLTLVSREKFERKLRLIRKKTRRLRDLRKRARKSREKCERKLGYVRVEHGLPSDKYEARVEFNEDGDAKVIQKGETSLDDAIKRSRSE